MTALGKKSKNPRISESKRPRKYLLLLIFGVVLCCALRGSILSELTILCARKDLAFYFLAPTRRHLKFPYLPHLTTIKIK